MENEVVLSQNQAATVNDMMFDMAKFEMVERFAEIMASGKCTMPDHLKGSPGDCFAVISQAVMWRMNPFAVAQKTHIVSGKLGYEAQLINAVINSLAPTKDRIKYDWFGPWENVIGKFRVVTNQQGKPYQVPDWKPSDEVGCGIRIWATLKGEDEPRYLDLLLQQATVRNSTLWASDPKQQLAYLAVKRWSRLYCPEVIMGVYTPDEIEECEIKNITPEDQSTKPKSAIDRLAKKIGAGSKKQQQDQPPIDVPTVPVEPKISELIHAEIERSGAPITVADVERYLISINTATGDIDNPENYSEKNYRYTIENIEKLVKKVAELNVSEPQKDGLI